MDSVRNFEQSPPVNHCANFGESPENDEKLEQLNKVKAACSSALLARFISNDHLAKTALYMSKTVKHTNSDFLVINSTTTVEEIDKFCSENGLENWNFSFGYSTVLREAISQENEEVFDHIMNKHSYLKNIGEFGPIYYTLCNKKKNIQFLKNLIKIGTDINRCVLYNTALDWAMFMNDAESIDLILFSGGCAYETDSPQVYLRKVELIKASVSRLFKKVQTLCFILNFPASDIPKLPKEICYKIMVDALDVEFFSPTITEPS